MRESLVIEITDLSYTYPDGRQALNNISFVLNQGEKVALIGPNGAGKSTLLLNLNGLLKGNGEIFVNGKQVIKQNLSSVRALVGLVFQNPEDQLFSPTVFDDVAYGPLYQNLPFDMVQERVENALVAVDMLQYATRVPHHLSQGEKKRIALATVLSMEPVILVLDEPSAGLDPRARRNLIELLKSLPYAMLIATHDLEMARELVSRIIVMDNGEIVADGGTVNILNNTNLLKEHGLLL